MLITLFGLTQILPLWTLASVNPLRGSSIVEWLPRERAGRGNPGLAKDQTRSHPIMES